MSKKKSASYTEHRFGDFLLEVMSPVSGSIQHSMGTMYHAEVPLKIEIPLVSDLGIEYVLQVESRADGIIADIIMTRMAIKSRRAMQ